MKAAGNHLEIAIAGDSNYLVPLTVLLASLFDSNPHAGITVNFLYLDSAVSDSDLAALEAFVAGHGQRMRRLPVSERQLGRIPESRHSKSTWLRLLLPELLPDAVDKVLYLDGDIVVCGDLAPLYRTDITDFYVAAVKDPTIVHGRAYCREVGIPDEAQYINAGVLLMNVDRMRRERITEAFFDHLHRHIDRLVANDQDVLNAVLWRAVKYVSPVYNYNFWTERDVAGQLFPAQEIAAVRRRPVIVHYIGPVKPWHYKSIHPKRALWWKFLKLTPYKDFRPANITVRDRLTRLFLLAVVKPVKPWLTLRRKRSLGRLLPAGLRKTVRRKLFRAQ